MGERQAAARCRKGKLLLKGILAHEDAKLGRRCRDRRHRRLQPWRAGGGLLSATIDVLPEIVAAVGGKMPVLGRQRFSPRRRHRQGAGAGRASRVYRPALLWGLGAFGQAGVERVLELLRGETRAAMQQLGAPTIRDITPAMVRGCDFISHNLTCNHLVAYCQCAPVIPGLAKREPGDCLSCQEDSGL